MYVRIFCGDLELGNKYEDAFKELASKGAYDIQLTARPGDLVSTYCKLEEKFAKDKVVVKVYDNGVFESADPPQEAKQKTDTWWKNLGFPAKVVYDSSKKSDLVDGNPRTEESVFKLLRAESKSEKGQYVGENGDFTEEWNEINVIWSRGDLV